MDLHSLKDNLQHKTKSYISVYRFSARVYHDLNMYPGYPKKVYTIIMILIFVWCRRFRTPHLKMSAIIRISQTYHFQSTIWWQPRIQPVASGPLTVVRDFRHLWSVFYPSAIKAVGYSDHQRRASDRTVRNLALTKKLTDEFCLFFTDMTYVPGQFIPYTFFAPSHKPPFSKMAA